MPRAPYHHRKHTRPPHTDSAVLALDDAAVLGTELAVLPQRGAPLAGVHRTAAARNAAAQAEARQAEVEVAPAGAPKPHLLCAAPADAARACVC